MTLMQLSLLDRLVRLFDPVPPLGVPRDLHEASLRAADGDAKLRLGLGLAAVGIVAVALYWACFA
ncbi:MAG: hypothetical protein JSS04_23580 [Proteobacteria bacterium]|nr:hypothetical protein [Pseudomonadota bacterium]